MPYKTAKDLPMGPAQLPEEAKNIYLAAFNSAWDEYKGDEAKCAAVAWAAVKNVFAEKRGKWTKKATAESRTLQTGGFPVLVLAESSPILSEVADPEWLTEELVEGADGPKKLIATLIRAGPNNSDTREYTPEFLKKCIADGRFTGCYSYLNHPTIQEARDRPFRDQRFLAGRTGVAFWDESAQEVKAEFVFIAEEHPMSMGSLAKQQFADPVVRARSGLSIWYQGPVDCAEADNARRPGRKIQVPRSLGDDRKFDVDIVTAPGAGGGLPLGESEQPKEEPPMETLDDLKAQCPELVAQLREEWEAEQPPAPVPETPPAPLAEADPPSPPPTEAPALDSVLVSLQEEVARLKSREMLDEALSEEPVPDAVKKSARAILREDVYPDKASFGRKFRATITGLNEAASAAAGPRVAGLGGPPPAGSDEKHLTFGDCLKKEAQ